MNGAVSSPCVGITFFMVKLSKQKYMTRIFLKILFAIVFIGVSLTVFSQGNGEKFNVTKDYDYLVNRIKYDYPGYQDKVTPEILALEKELSIKVRKFPDSLYTYLAQYVSLFKDPHLRVSRVFKSYGNPIKKSLSEYEKNLWEKIRFSSQDENLGSMEGLWTSLWGDVYMTAKPGQTDTYLIISQDFTDWTPGKIIYELTFDKDSTTFNVKEYSLYGTKSYASIFPRAKYASLEINGQVLEIHGTNIYFIRKSDSSTSDEAFLYTYHPVSPNGKNNYWIAQPLNDSTFFLRIPSFDNAKDKITSLISGNLNLISCRPNLIIDIRGNIGGQSDAYEALLPILYTNPYEQKGVAWYASQGNIDDFERAIKTDNIREGGLPWTIALVEEMKKNKGKFIVHPAENGSEIIRRDSVYKYPRNVGIILSENNASAAEQFLLTAKNSRKVTLFGNGATAGVLDYSNVTPHLLPSGRYELYLPKTRSLRLPDNPIDNIGISPDIIIPFPEVEDTFDRLDDWVYFVMHYLESLPVESL